MCDSTRRKRSWKNASGSQGLGSSSEEESLPSKLVGPPPLSTERGLTKHFRQSSDARLGNMEGKFIIAGRSNRWPFEVNGAGNFQNSARTYGEKSRRLAMRGVTRPCGSCKGCHVIVIAVRLDTITVSGTVEI